MSIDLRYKLAKERFESLTDEQLRRIEDNLDLVCYDTYNFSSEDQTYCPMAIAFDLHHSVEKPSQEKIFSELAKFFNPVNCFKGVPGTFYTVNRKEDLLQLLKEVKDTRNRLLDKIKTMAQEPNWPRDSKSAEDLFPSRKSFLTQREEELYKENIKLKEENAGLKLVIFEMAKQTTGKILVNTDVHTMD